MKVFSFLIFLLLGLTSCVHEYKYCTYETKDELLSAYNDVINELVERRFYNFYLGKDEETIFKAYVEKPQDTTSIRAEIIRLQNEIYRDTSRFCTLYLDTILKPGFAKLKYYETDTGDYSAQFITLISSIYNDKQSVIDTLNQRQTTRIFLGSTITLRKEIYKKMSSTQLASCHSLRIRPFDQGLCKCV